MQKGFAFIINDCWKSAQLHIIVNVKSASELCFHQEIRYETFRNSKVSNRVSYSSFYGFIRESR